VDIVKDGTWVGVLSGRDSSAIAGLPPGGMVRGDGYNRLPMVRMTNVGLLPGDSSLEEIIADTKDGIYMSTNRSWSIDDKRLNFQFGTEVGWEVKDGKLGKMVRNPTYTGITPQFWGTMDRLAGGDEWVHWGTPNCGKGEPIQVGHTGHSAAPARFSKVRVGVRGCPTASWPSKFSISSAIAPRPKSESREATHPSRGSPTPSSTRTWERAA